MQIDARGWIFEISPDDGTTWNAIGGLTEWNFNPSENEEVADTTTFDSQGMHESQAMQRGAILELTGRYLDDAGTRDPGQAAVEDAAAKVSNDSLVQFRFRHTSQSNWKKWPNAWVTLGEQGGANNAKTSWACTMRRSGASVTEAVV